MIMRGILSFSSHSVFKVPQVFYMDSASQFKRATFLNGCWWLMATTGQSSSRGYRRVELKVVPTPSITQSHVQTQNLSPP